jgi:outer membrane protein assembly factor BamB
MPVGGGYSGPSVADGRLFVMDYQAAPVPPDQAEKRQGPKVGKERVLCVDAATGRELWSHTYDVTYKIGYGSGPRVTPTVDGDRVYTLGAMGQLICFRADDGRILWQKQIADTYGATPPVWGYAAHPLVDGERLICTVGGEGSAVVAFDKMTGEEIWKSLTAEEIGYAPPVMFEQAGQRQLVVWYDVALAGLDPQTGAELWSVPFPGQEPQRPSVTIMTPRTEGNQVFISNFYDGCMVVDVAGDPPSATVRWSSVGKDTDHANDINTVMTTPIFHEGHVYGIAGNGELRCLDAASGDLVWRTNQPLALAGQDPSQAGEDFSGFPALFLVGRGDQRYFLFTDQGELVIAELTPAGYNELDRAKLLETSAETRGRPYVWCHPAFAQGHIFVRNEKEMIAVDMRDKS